jgi:hypothetical protein
VVLSVVWCGLCTYGRFRRHCVQGGPARRCTNASLASIASAMLASSGEAKAVVQGGPARRCTNASLASIASATLASSGEAKAVDNAELVAAVPAKKNCVTVDVTLTMDTAIYAANEVLADTQVISNVFRANDVGGEHAACVLRVERKLLARA